MRADEAAPHLSRLAEFLLPRLTAWQLASSTIKGEEEPRSTYVTLEQAMGHQWWSPSTRAWCNVMVVDADRSDWRGRLNRMVARGLPRPAYTVASPWKGSAHIVWILACPFQNRDPGEVRMKAGIRRGLDAELGGDPRFTNRLTKNPWHRADGPVEPRADIPCGDPDLWAAYVAAGHQLTYHTEIGDLRAVTAAELLEPLLACADERDEWLLSPRPRWNPVGATWSPPAVTIPGVRLGQDPSVAFFGACADAVRRACTGRKPVIRGIVDRTAATWRLTVSEKSRAEMTESIATWMNTRWRGPLDGTPGKDRAVGRKQIDAGVMKGEAADKGPEALAEWCASTWTERRQAAGRRSASMIKEDHRRALRQARADLVTEGARPTQAAVAIRAGLSLSTVKRNWAQLDERPVVAPGHGVTRSNLSCGDLVEVLSLPFPKTESSPLPSSEVLAIASYVAASSRMAQRGANPEEILLPPLGSSPALVSAYQTARSARASAQRRQQARRQKVVAKVRAAAREEWHIQHVGCDAAWQARLCELSSQESIAVESILRSGGCLSALDRTELMFKSIRGAEERAHRRALGEVPRMRRRERRVWFRGPDEIDLAIPW